MQQKKIPLAEASEAQLRDFAGRHLGMELPAGAKIETLRSKIRQAWTQPDIHVLDEHTAFVGGRSVSLGDGFGSHGFVSNGIEHFMFEANGRKKVRVILNRSEEAGGSEPVQVGVNGKVMLVPRGEEVEIPVEYFEVLQNAVRHIFDPLKDGGLSEPRKVPMYPYQLLPPPRNLQAA